MLPILYILLEYSTLFQVQFSLLILLNGFKELPNIKICIKKKVQLLCSLRVSGLLSYGPLSAITILNKRGGLSSLFSF